MSESDSPLKWQDESVFGSLYPTEPSAKGPADAPSPAGTRGAPSDRVLPEASVPTTSAEKAKARIEAIWNDPSHPFHRGSPEALDEYLALTRLAHPDRTTPETPPRSLAEADLPRFTLPADTPADDPDVRALREITAHAGLESSLVQGAIDQVVRLVKEPVPDDPAERDALMEREGERAIQAARDKYGFRYGTMVEQVGIGKAILRAEAPQLLALLHSHPHMANNMELFEALAALGARSRAFHVSKFGTSRALRM